MFSRDASDFHINSFARQHQATHKIRVKELTPKLLTDEVRASQSFEALTQIPPSDCVFSYFPWTVSLVSCEHLRFMLPTHWRNLRATHPCQAAIHPWLECSPVWRNWSLCWTSLVIRNGLEWTFLCLLNGHFSSNNIHLFLFAKSEPESSFNFNLTLCRQNFLMLSDILGKHRDCNSCMSLYHGNAA